MSGASSIVGLARARPFGLPNPPDKGEIRSGIATAMNAAGVQVNTRCRLNIGETAQLLRGHTRTLGGALTLKAYAGPSRFHVPDPAALKTMPDWLEITEARRSRTPRRSSFRLPADSEPDKASGWSVEA